MGFNSVSNAIRTKLLGINELVSVYDYHTDEVSGYPAATFEPAGLINEMYSSEDNLRQYQFNIVIHQQLQTTGRQASIATLRKAVDAVVAAFDGDYNLSGASDYSLPIPVSYGEYVKGNGSVKYASITFTAISEEST